MNFSKFESIGAYLPERIKTTEEMVDEMTNPPQFDLADITGIQNRRIRNEDEDTLTIAVHAAKDCLRRSKYKAEDLDIIISCSISRFIGHPDHQKCYFEPSMSFLIKEILGVNKPINFDVSNACAGMHTGVYILDSMIRTGMVKNGMVVSGECISPITDTAVKEVMDAYDPQFGSLTVGDSGAAVILDKAVDEKDMIEYFNIMTCSEYSHLCIGMPSLLNNHMALYTNNAQMHKEDRVKMWPHFQKEFLEKKGPTFSQEGYDYIIQHQVGLKAIKKFNKLGEQYMESEMPESLATVDRYGNTATTSHYVVLHHYLKEKKIQKGAKILIVPAASGFVTGFLSVVISNLEV